MEAKGKIRLRLGIALVACLILLSIVAWSGAFDEEIDQKQFLANFGEIKRIDEVLTSSALLATATGDDRYKQRYLTHVRELGDLVDQTMEMSDQLDARDILRQTFALNDSLITTEMNALEATNGVPNLSANASLLTVEFLHNKKKFRTEIDRVFAELCEIVDRQMQLVHHSFVGLVLALAITGLLALWLMWNAQVASLARKNQDDVVHTMSAMIRTFMDVQNNLLNNMVYFRTKAAHNLPFDDQEVALIDAEIGLAKEKLAEIAKTDLAQTRDLGGIVVMVNGAPSKSPKPKYANAA